MILSEQCCLLEQSQELERLGVTAESQCVHMRRARGKEDFEVMHVSDLRVDSEYWVLYEQAYTVAELARPVAQWVGNNAPSAELREVMDKWAEAQKQNEVAILYNPQFLADCLIHLLEKNLLTAEQVNEAINNGK